MADKKSTSMFSRGQYQDLLGNDSFKMAMASVTMMTDENKIRVLEEICKHFNVSSERMTEKIRRTNEISTRSKFADDLYDGKYNGDKPMPWMKHFK